MNVPEVWQDLHFPVRIPCHPSTLVMRAQPSDYLSSDYTIIYNLMSLVSRRLLYVWHSDEYFTVLSGYIAHATQREESDYKRAI